MISIMPKLQNRSRVLQGDTAFRFLLGIGLAIYSSSCFAQDSETRVSTSQIEAWIQDLNHSDYSTRELATIRLNLQKKEAVPLVVRALETANTEQLDRLWQFLSSIAADPYSLDGEYAFNSILALTKSRTTSRAARAQRILQSIGIEQQDLALEKLATVGLDVRDRQLQVISTRVDVPNALVIDRNFQGDIQTLECLRWLSLVEFVKLEGARINRQILQFVVRLPNLKKLQLVNTELTAKDIEVLLDAPELDLLEFIYVPFGDEAIDVLRRLPVIGDLYLFGSNLSNAGQKELVDTIEGPDLMVSRGGFLGVMCQASSVVVDDVVANGAAEAAEMRRFDKILSIDGIPVYVFDDIRRELAKHAPGEEVTIRYERQEFLGGQRQKKVYERSTKLMKRQDMTRER